MLTFFWTVCSLEKVLGFPARSVSTRVSSLTCTWTLRAIGMILPSHVVLPMLPERCRDVYEIEAQDQEPSIVENGEISPGGFMSINVDIV